MKNLLSLIYLSLLFVVANAQTSITANDSVNLEEEAVSTTFYSLATNSKTVADYNNWHLMITVRATQFPGSPLGGTTIRANQAFGTKVYYVPNAGAADFNTLDTTGYRNWEKLQDSDTSIDEGALNSNRDRSQIFDFGWGVYNGSSHNVTGDSIYLVQLPTGELKKFLVVNLDKDTAFNLKYSNIDNSDLQTLHISKKAFLGKEFVYLNLLDNTIEDKEPHLADWDLQFLKYTATDVVSGQFIPQVGVWLNKGTLAAKRSHHDVNDNSLTGLNFSDDLNTIGWNWKYPGSFGALISGKNTPSTIEFYKVEDSLAYFIQTKAGDFYKLVFTGYNVNKGKIKFYKEKLSGSTGVEETTTENVSGIYPNPANSVLNIALNTTEAQLKVFDLSGRLITETVSLQNTVQLNTSEFANGVYVLQTIANGKVSVKRFVVNR